MDQAAIASAKLGIGRLVFCLSPPGSLHFSERASPEADMTMSEERVPPTGTAWRDAQQRVSERNEQARKTGRAKRDAHDKQLAAQRREKTKNQNLYT
ncbi:MAG: hypothetical protein NVSMB25_18780 [Thermoleophilaceae bacterium]